MTRPLGLRLHKLCINDGLVVTVILPILFYTTKVVLIVLGRLTKTEVLLLLLLMFLRSEGLILVVYQVQQGIRIRLILRRIVLVRLQIPRLLIRSSVVRWQWRPVLQWIHVPLIHLDVLRHVWYAVLCAAGRNLLL